MHIMAKPGKEVPIDVVNKFYQPAFDGTAVEYNVPDVVSNDRRIQEAVLFMRFQGRLGVAFDQIKFN